MAEFFTPQKTKKEVWYKEPWMLLVLGGPVIVVIAAIVTFYLAWQGSDKVVSKDYYKQGLNIDKDIYRDRKASEYQIQATVKLDPATGQLLLQLAGKTELPSTVLFSYSTASDTSSEFELSQKTALPQEQPGLYKGKLTIPPASDTSGSKLWHVKIEASDWRLTADWRDPLHSPLQLKSQN